MMYKNVLKWKILNSNFFKVAVLKRTWKIVSSRLLENISNQHTCQTAIVCCSSVVMECWIIAYLLQHACQGLPDVLLSQNPFHGYPQSQWQPFHFAWIRLCKRREGSIWENQRILQAIKDMNSLIGSFITWMLCHFIFSTPLSVYHVVCHIKIR